MGRPRGQSILPSRSQMKVLRAFERLRARRGGSVVGELSPSIYEVAAHLRRGHSTVGAAFLALERLGLVSRDPGTNRSLETTALGRQALQAFADRGSWAAWLANLTGPDRRAQGGGR